MKIAQSDSLRFWPKVDSSNKKKSECWMWLGAKTGRYGAFWFGGKQGRAHHFAVMLSGRTIPSGKIVMHKCDNCLCVNPNHLVIGTQSENLLDCVAKGRHKRIAVTGDRHGSKTHPERVARGERVNTAKLCADDVIEIRRLHLEGLSCSEIAKKFPIKPNSISQIIRREHWRHV